MDKITRALHLDPDPPDEHEPQALIRYRRVVACLLCLRQDDPPPLQGPGLSRLSSNMEVSGSLGLPGPFGTRKVPGF